MPMSVEQHCGLLSNQCGDGPEGGSASGGLDEQVDLPAPGQVGNHLHQVGLPHVQRRSSETLHQAQLLRNTVRHQDDPFESHFPPQVLQKQEAGGSGAQDQDVFDRPGPVRARMEHVAGGGAHHPVQGVEDASQGFREGGLGETHPSRQPDRVHRGNRDPFPHSSRNAGDAQLLIVETLVRVPAFTVLADRSDPLTVAVQALVHGHPVPGRQVPNLGARFQYGPAEFVPQDLGLDRERNRPSLRVGVVVGLALKDVKVGAADAHRTDLDQDVVISAFRFRDIAQLETSGAFQQKSLHGIRSILPAGTRDVHADSRTGPAEFPASETGAAGGVRRDTET